MPVAILSLLLFLTAPLSPLPQFPSLAGQQAAGSFTPTADYVVHEFRGWRVLMNPAITAADPKLQRDTLELLDNQLYQITRVIPEPALGRLKEVEIWVELGMPQTACMCYHPSKDWLIPNGYNPDKEGVVEVGNARAFLEWTRGQPWMVLHELAHAFHHQEFGFDHQPISEAHGLMVASGLYDDVQHISGASRRHYALTDPMEYFAETTEALFGTNDFHPYVRSELLVVDPDGAEVVRRCWTRWKPELTLPESVISPDSAP
jgi:hypothetical protein